jgi:peptide/nickel transport system substrate-binding protein
MKGLTRLLKIGAAVSLISATAFGTPADNTIVVGLSTDVATFDPAQGDSRDNLNIDELIFGRLYTVDADGAIKPSLANTYAVSDDGTEYTFTLKPGLTCEDGETLTAKDVAYSFDRAADPKNRFTGNTPGFVFTSLGFVSAKAIDDLNVRVKLAKKSSITLGMLSEVLIHCKAPYERMTLEQAAAKPVGSGSYRLVSWARGSEIVLEKVKDPGFFKRIVFRIIPEASTRSAELIAGNVDIITNVAPDQVGPIDISGTASVQKVQGTRRIYVGFNQSEKFSGTPGMDAIKKPDVRRALQYAVDVPAICSALLNFECQRATSQVNPPNGNPDLKPYPYDPDKAEKLLDEAGYPRGANGVRFELKLQAPRGRYLNDANVALAIGQYLSDIGVSTDVEILDFASVYSPLTRAHEAGPLFLAGEGGSTWSAIYDMADLATAKSEPNSTGWQDPRWFDAWADIDAAKTPEEERSVINRMLKVFHDDGPWLFLYFQPDFYGVSKRISWRARRDERIDLLDATLAH